jgi:RNA polymerase sigma-70 factor, ECF subfamily
MGPSAGERTIESHDTEALYREHGAAVTAFCRSLLRDRNEAEDATQQVFLSAHRALLNGSAPREPLAWLLTVARHECYTRFHQRATAPLPVGEPPEQATADASTHALRSRELATVWDEVGRMPATQRQAFLLRELRGLSYGQLADELSLSTPSVRSLLLRARARLRHRLGDVAAGIGGAPWIQALVRLVAGGDGASPVPAATKAAAVGIGAIALMGGADVTRAPHHASTTPPRAPAPVRPAAVPATAADVRREDRPRPEGREAEHERSRGGDDGGSSRSGESSSGRSSDHEDATRRGPGSSGSGGSDRGRDGGSDEAHGDGGSDDGGGHGSRGHDG